MKQITTTSMVYFRRGMPIVFNWFMRASSNIERFVLVLLTNLLAFFERDYQLIAYHQTRLNRRLLTLQTPKIRFFAFLQSQHKWLVVWVLVFVGFQNAHDATPTIGFIANLTKSPQNAITPIWNLDCVPTMGPGLK